MTSKRVQLLLMAPAMLLFATIFVGPLIAFATDILALQAPLSQTIAETFGTFTSRPVIHALWSTNVVGFSVTLLCLVAGYPLAYAMTVVSPVGFGVISTCIILPYFVSVVVRTYSWMIILGKGGIVNTALIKLGIISIPLPLMYNMFSIIVAMAYIMLPYMVLTLYATMREIDKNLVRAGQSLGGSRFYVFRCVYLPLSSHAIYSGSVLVFMLCLGFFVTPALMGGTSNVLIAMLIVNKVDVDLNFRSAAILSVLLCASTSVLYYIYMKVSNIGSLLEESK